MTTAYLLPCTCGEKLRIDATQAGLDVRCRCGRDVKAPTLRGLSELERVEEAIVSKPRQESGAQHRLILIGSLVTVCGLAVAAWFWVTTPPYDPIITLDPRLPKQIAAEVEAMTPDKLIEAWETFPQEALDRSEPAYLPHYRREVTRRHGFMYAGLAIAVIGGCVLASSFVVGKPRPEAAR